MLKTLPWYFRVASLAIGEQIKTGRQDLLKEFRAEPAAIKHHGEPAPADQTMDLFEQSRQHLNQTSIGLGRDDEQRIATCIVDSIVRGRWHGEAHPGHMGFGQRVLTVVHPHVTIEVEEA